MKSTSTGAVPSVEFSYDSRDGPLGARFFAPCLAACERYDRETGYFRSTALAAWALALPRLAAHTALQIRVITSPDLARADLEAIEAARDPVRRAALTERAIERWMDDALALREHPGDRPRQLALFAWLIASGRLELRFALPTEPEGHAMYHAKSGCFHFAGGERIAFIGSANETHGGLRANYESIMVFAAGEGPDGRRVERVQRDFELKWENGCEGLNVLRLGERTLERLRALVPDDPPSAEDFAGAEERAPHRPPRALPLNRWRHQDEAMSAFLEARHGVLEMATGTGKTRTALNCLSALFADERIDGVVVTVGGTALLDQWYAEMLGWDFGRRLLLCRQFGPHRELERFAHDPRGRALIVSRGQLERLFGALAPSARRRLAIVHDEVHGFGSASMQSLAGEHHHFAYRLGLSATPEREHDEQGTRYIEEEIGPVLYRFGLEDAIRRGILCPFDYVPLRYPLTDDDRQRLRDVYKRQSSREKHGPPMSQEELFRELAAVYKTAEMKPAVFRRYLAEHPSILQRSVLFFHSKAHASSVMPDIQRVTSAYRTFYGEDDLEELKRFARGRYDCLLTCHRLSEGIDVRGLRHVVLFASDSASLETVQRIGRALRSDPSDPDKRAVIVDFVRESGDDDAPSGDDAPSRPENADERRCRWLSALANVQPEG